MADRYRHFTELLEAEGQSAFAIEECDCGSDIVVVAPHAGGIEPGTSEIARAIAGVDLSYYLFEGLKPARNSDLHITSTNFDEPRCLEFLRRARTAVAVHGEGSDEEIIYLGGRDARAIQQLREAADQDGFYAVFSV